MWINIFWIGIGSMLGGISRYLVSLGIKQWFPTLFPWGTLSINVIGSLFIGIVTGLFLSSSISTSQRLFLAVGFCGSFTTFSTFSLENLQLLSGKAYFLLSLNIGASLLLGLAGVWLGLKLTQQIL